MRLPEPPVRSRQLRELGGQVRAGMELGIGKVPPDQSQVGVPPEQRLDRQLRRVAEPATEVAVLDQRQLDRTPDHVIVRPDGARFASPTELTPARKGSPARPVYSPTSDGQERASVIRRRRMWP